MGVAFTFHVRGNESADSQGERIVFTVCPSCGEYSEEKEIDAACPFAICPYCGYRHRSVHLPLFIITGASGTGKERAASTTPPLMSLLDTSTLTIQEAVEQSAAWVHRYVS